MLFFGHMYSYCLNRNNSTHHDLIKMVFTALACYLLFLKMVEIETFRIKSYSPKFDIQIRNLYAGRLNYYVFFKTTFKLLKIPFFDSPASKSDTRYQKIISEYWLKYENLLNFSNTMKSMTNCHYTNMYSILNSLLWHFFL